MKVQIHLENNETLLDAEDELVKALTSKHECDIEQYSDPAIEEAANLVCKQHKELLESLAQSIKSEIYASSKNSYR